MDRTLIWTIHILVILFENNLWGDLFYLDVFTTKKYWILILVGLIILFPFIKKGKKVGRNDKNILEHSFGR